MTPQELQSAGFTPAEIKQYTDLQDAGFSDDEIVQHLSGTKPTAPTKPIPVLTRTPEKTIGGLLKNYGGQLWDQAKFFATTDPIELAGGLAKLGAGGLLAHWRNTGLNMPPAGPMEQGAREVGKQFVSGGKQLINDPLTWMYERPLDTSLILGGGLGMLGKAAEGAELGRTASVLNKAKNVVNPLNAVTDKLGWTGVKPGGTGVEIDTPKYFRKAINPQTAKKGVLVGEVEEGAIQSSTAAYDQSINKVVNAAINMKDDLKILNDTGMEVPFIPSEAGVEELSQVVPQIRKKVYKGYNDMMLAANGEGLMADTAPIRQMLLDKYVNPFKRNFDEKTTQFAQDWAAKLKAYNNGKLTLEEAQDLVEQLNKQLEPLMRSGAIESGTQKSVLGDIARGLRDELDTKITSIKGEGYQDLRNLYKATKDVEEHIRRKAASLYGKADLNDMDVYDIYSLSLSVGGLVSGNPAGLAKAAAVQLAKRSMKYNRSPDTLIAKMFTNAENKLGRQAYLEAEAARKAAQAAAPTRPETQFLPGAQQSPIPAGAPEPGNYPRLPAPDSQIGARAEPQNFAMQIKPIVDEGAAVGPKLVSSHQPNRTVSELQWARGHSPAPLSKGETLAQLQEYTKTSPAAQSAEVFAKAMRDRKSKTAMDTLRAVLGKKEEVASWVPTSAPDVPPVVAKGFGPKLQESALTKFMNGDKLNSREQEFINKYSAYTKRMVDRLGK